MGRPNESSGLLSNPDALPRAAEVAWSPGSPIALTAFVNVNVVPMDTERVLANQTVLVDGGRITALGPANQVNVPAGAVRIDGRGKYLMPGLTDMHAHVHLYIQLEGDKPDSKESVRQKLLSYLAYGVTGVRYLATGVEPWLPLRPPEVLGPRLYLSPTLYTRSGLWETKRSEIITTSSLDSLAVHVAAFKAAGYDFIEMPSEYRRSDDTALVARYDSIAAAARRLGLTIASHTNDESFADLLAFGAYGGSVEHLHYAFRDLLGPQGGAPSDSGLRAWAATVPDSALRAWAATVPDSTLRRRVAAIPDSVLHAWAAAVPDSMLRARAAAVRRAGTWVSPTLDCVENRNFGNLGVARRLVKALQDAGVGLLLGADAESRSPAVIHVELGNLVRAGLTPYQALATGTRNVAEYFGTRDSMGTVAVGQRADLLLLYGNPLTDVRRLREPAGVMIAGRWVDQATLDQGLLWSLKAWLEGTAQGGFPNTKRGQIHLPNADAQKKSFRVLHELADSLERVGPAVRADGSYERLVQRFSAELGVVFPLLSPAQRDSFEPMVRVWMREQVRRGYRLVVPGVAPEP